jgi:hypothetical protein
MNQFIGFIALVMSTGLFANPEREVITCANEHYQLVVRETAVVTLRQATLTFSNRTIGMKCEVVLENNNYSHTEISCEEDRAGDGRYLAGITVVKEEGQAELSHEQIYPLKPKTLANLSCKVTYE